MVQEHTIFVAGDQDKYRMIFPTPVYEEYGEEEYALKEIYETADLYDFYCSTKSGNKDIALQVRQDLETEEYSIVINAEGIQIGYATDAGLFRALTSVRQLIDYGEKKKVPFAEIKDKPQFKHRGLMFEIIGSFRQYKPEMLCKIIDYLAELKYNELQLYMDTPTCFRYEVFADVIGETDSLTAEDIKMLDQYCKDRFIELVPNQNGFGHMKNWLKLEAFQHLEVSDGITKTGTLNILDPEAFELMDKIYGSLLPHFSSKRVNIGLDEAYGLGSYQLEQICKEKGKAQVFMDWLNKLSNLCEKKYGKKVMFWADMITEYPDFFDQIPENAMPVEWGYEDINAQLVPDSCRALKACGRSYYVAPSTDTWGTFAGRGDTGCNNIRTYGEVGQKHGADGYLLTIWGGSGFVWELVPIALAAQYSWNVGIKQHCGWRKSYFVHNAQDYVDRYILGSRVARDLCKVADTCLMEPERVACGSIVQQMITLPLSQNIRPDFYDVAEIFEEYHVDNIVNSVQKVIDKLQGVEFEETYRREFLMDAKTIILGAEYIRIHITGKVTAEKARELGELAEFVIREREALQAERCYQDEADPITEAIKVRQQEVANYLV